MPNPDKRKEPGRAPHAVDDDAEIEHEESNIERLSGQHRSAQHLQDYADLEADIETAEAYERVLAPKAYRVRKLILNLKIKREALEELGAALTDRRAA